MIRALPLLLAVLAACTEEDNNSHTTWLFDPSTDGHGLQIVPNDAGDAADAADPDAGDGGP